MNGINNFCSVGNISIVSMKWCAGFLWLTILVAWIYAILNNIGMLFTKWISMLVFLFVIMSSANACVLLTVFVSNTNKFSIIWNLTKREFYYWQIHFEWIGRYLLSIHVSMANSIWNLTKINILWIGVLFIVLVIEPIFVWIVIVVIWKSMNMHSIIRVSTTCS